jgi:hypothetical protein
MMTPQRKWLAGFLCMAVVVSSAGCEPLRKKFTRQKKKDKETSDFIPVLEPVDYPVKQYGAKEAYAQHYSLFKVWFSDFDTSRREAANEKKMVYDLDAALKELGEMENLLKGPSKDELVKVKGQVQFIRDEFSKPKAFRNEGRINNEFNSADMAIRKKFKPNALSADLAN